MALTKRVTDLVNEARTKFNCGEQGAREALDKLLEARDFLRNQHGLVKTDDDWRQAREVYCQAYRDLSPTLQALEAVAERDVASGKYRDVY